MGNNVELKSRKCNKFLLIAVVGVVCIFYFAFGRSPKFARDSLTSQQGDFGISASTFVNEWNKYAKHRSKQTELLSLPEFTETGKEMRISNSTYVTLWENEKGNLLAIQFRWLADTWYNQDTATLYMLGSMMAIFRLDNLVDIHGDDVLYGSEFEFAEKNIHNIFWISEDGFNYKFECV